MGSYSKKARKGVSAPRGIMEIVPFNDKIISVYYIPRSEQGRSIELQYNILSQRSRSTKLKHLSIPHITEEQSLEMRLMGTVGSSHLEACAIKGFECGGERFAEVVKGYRINENPGKEHLELLRAQPGSVFVNFYGLW